MDVANNGEALTAKSALPENIDSLISELKIDQKRVPELWEARSKQLSLCKDALVLKHFMLIQFFAWQILRILI